MNGKRTYTMAAVLGALACTDASVPIAVPAPPETPPRHGPFSIRPALDTASVFDSVKFVVEGDSTVGQWVLSDTTITDLLEKGGGWAVVGARAPGTVIVTARRYGDSGQDSAKATLVIREPDPTGWEAIDLGLLDDAASGVSGAINDAGTVVGTLHRPDGSGRGFIYKDGAMHLLPYPGDDYGPAAISPSGKIAGYASGESGGLIVWDTPDAAPRRLDERRVERIIGINDGGDVLITTWSGNYKYSPRFRGVLWRNNVRVDLGDLDLSDSTSDSAAVRPTTMVNAWNSRSQIVGKSQVRQVPRTDNLDPIHVFHPFIWESGVMRDLGVLTPLPCTNVATPADCAWGEAADINAHGVVVGVVNDAQNRYRAFIWENGIMRDLGVAPGHSTQAFAINDRGQVMGVIDGYTVFLWENGQTQITIPPYSLWPLALGPTGAVVGWRGGRDSHAVVWEAGQWIDLGRGEARAINAHGDIIGWSRCCGYNHPMLWRRKAGNAKTH